MSVSHDHPRFQDPSYEPYSLKVDEYDGPDYQTEVLAEERREEALRRKEQAPAQEMTTAIENAWIDVKDKMPDFGRNVLVYCPYWSEEPFIACYLSIGIWQGERILSESYATAQTPTHWAPIPAPPGKQHDSFTCTREKCPACAIESKSEGQ